MKIQRIVKIWSIGALKISLYNHWLGFGYRDFGFAKRQDFGFIKFWVEDETTFYN